MKQELINSQETIQKQVEAKARDEELSKLRINNRTYILKIEELENYLDALREGLASKDEETERFSAELERCRLDNEAL